MTARSKWIVGVFCTLSILAAAGYYAIRASSTSTGIAALVVEVPLIGKLLPKDLTLKDIRFRSYGGSDEVVLRATATEKDFDAITAHWQANEVRYESGFSYPGGVTEPAFRPDGDRMYVSVVPGVAGSRRHAWVFFEPGTSGEQGILYIHILR